MGKDALLAKLQEDYVLLLARWERALADNLTTYDPAWATGKDGQPCDDDEMGRYDEMSAERAEQAKALLEDYLATVATEAAKPTG